MQFRNLLAENLKFWPTPDQLVHVCLHPKSLQSVPVEVHLLHGNQEPGVHLLCFFDPVLFFFHQLRVDLPQLYFIHLVAEIFPEFKRNEPDSLGF